QPSETSSVTTSKPSSRNRAAIAAPMPRAAPVTSARLVTPLHRAVARPVALGDRVRVLVPVPGARVGREVLGRVGGIERIATPLDRQLLVHERAVRAVEREALAPVGPVVRLPGAPVSGRLVQALADEPLARAAR